MTPSPQVPPRQPPSLWSKAFALAAALAIGAAGGWFFSFLQLPLPWLLGSMTACLTAALLRIPIAVPAVVRPPMTSVIGVMLGASFSADLIARAATMVPTLIGMLIFAIVCGALCTAYLRLVAGFDFPTAFFAGMPGGLIDMTMLGEERGGNPHIIALGHSSRIALLVLTLPFLVQYLEGVQLGPRAPPGGSILDAPWSNHVWLLGTAAVGAIAGKWLRIPAGYMMGPLLVSAAVHISGVTDFIPSVEIVNVAQLVIGTSLGAGFARADPRLVLRILAISVGTTAILLMLTIGFAAVVSRFSDAEIVPLILAYSPGGLAEMSLIALALQIEVAFVVVHHVARVFLIVIGAAVVFRLVSGVAKPKS